MTTDEQLIPVMQFSENREDTPLPRSPPLVYDSPDVSCRDVASVTHGKAFVH